MVKKVYLRNKYFLKLTCPQKIYDKIGIQFSFNLLESIINFPRLSFLLVRQDWTLRSISWLRSLDPSPDALLYICVL